MGGQAAAWGRNYFPNIPLVTHEGETVRFFDDLVEGKIVVINFIYTTCPDTCPLETAQLVNVQRILGDRLGKDLFFYSISIDPKNDTPEVLKSYREQFGARWTFLTGSDADVTKLRKKLGLFIPEIQDGSSNHNVNMIIGNQSTGRWMKRSPFENPYVLADQIGNWLDGWKRPPKLDTYLRAPRLRDLPRGEQIFRTRWASCHTIEGQDRPGALGPDLLGVTHRRDPEWLLKWLRAPDQMLRDRDPIAMAMLEKYKNLPMPNLRLKQAEGKDVLKYLEEESDRQMKLRASKGEADLILVGQSDLRAGREGSGSDDGVVAIMNAWIRESLPSSRTNAGYLTMVNRGLEDQTLVGIDCGAFERSEIHEMARVEGLLRMRALKEIEIPAGEMVTFRPGGKHLMLINAARRLNRGEMIELSLFFKNGTRQVISLVVKKR